MAVDYSPGSPNWWGVISPSKVAAILGVSRWESAYRLWFRMKGLVEPEPDKDIFAIGHDFEPAMANMWLRENPGWRLSPGEVQIIADERLYGFPAAATLDRRAVRGRARRVVEFKTARDLDGWGDYFTDEAPADYVAQVMAEMLFTGYTKHPAHLMVLGPFFKAHTYVIPFDRSVASWIIKRCKEFWESLKGDDPPLLDDTVATYQCVRELHPDIDGSTIQYDAAEAIALLRMDATFKATEAMLRAAKTVLLDTMGEAQYAHVGDIKVADRRANGKGSVSLYLATKNLAQLQQLQEIPA